MEPSSTNKSDSIEDDVSSDQSTPSPTNEDLSENQVEDFNTIDIDALIAEADRKLAEIQSDPDIMEKIGPLLEPTKYSKAVTKISKFDSKLRALSMRDKALKRHSRSVKALLDAGKLKEAEELALQMPGNDLLDEECTDLEGGIFHQTELSSKPNLHLPRINTQGPLNLVGMEASGGVDEKSSDGGLISLSESEIERLEAILEKDILPENQALFSEEDVDRMEEINSKLEVLGCSAESILDTPVYENKNDTLEDILSRHELSEQFISVSKRKDLERIDTALELLKSLPATGELAPSDKIETVLSQITDPVSTK